MASAPRAEYFYNFKYLDFCGQLYDWFEKYSIQIRAGVYLVFIVKALSSIFSCNISQFGQSQSQKQKFDNSHCTNDSRWWYILNNYWVMVGII